MNIGPYKRYEMVSQSIEFLTDHNMLIYGDASTNSTCWQESTTLLAKKKLHVTSIYHLLTMLSATFLQNIPS